MPTKQELEAAGFYKIPTSKRFVQDAWMQAVYKTPLELDPKAPLLYFLEIDFSVFPDDRERVDASVVFYRASGIRFDVVFPIFPEMPLDYIHTFFGEIFEKLGCVPDPNVNINYRHH